MEFRGFLLLFWISLFVFMLQTFHSHYKIFGVVSKFELTEILGFDWMIFVLSEFLLVCYVFIPFALWKIFILFHPKLTEWKNDDSWPILGSPVNQHSHPDPVKLNLIPYWQRIVFYCFIAVLELIPIIGSVYWSLVRDWRWPTTATFTLHSCAMAMKMHSYLITNFHLYDCVLHVNLCRQYLETSNTDTSFSGTTDLIQEDRLSESMPTELFRVTRNSTLKSRINRANSNELDPVNTSVHMGRRRAQSVKQTVPGSKTHILSVYTKEEVERHLNAKTRDLTRTPVVRFPDNIKLNSFIDYVLVPTLVYEVEYPRKQEIRMAYIFEKIFATLGIFAVLFFMIEHIVYPVCLQLPNLSLFETILQLLIPCMVGWLLLFFLIFECICNSFAEMTRFADRRFYEDWWNSTSFDEFARKWNVPVHEFLLRHIYLQALSSPSVSKQKATIITFLFSSVLHELVVGATTRNPLGLFFVAQMMQIPLVWLMRGLSTRNKDGWIDRHPAIANGIVLCLLFTGIPLIVIVYIYRYFSKHQI